MERQRRASGAWQDAFWSSNSGRASGSPGSGCAGRGTLVASVRRDELLLVSPRVETALARGKGFLQPSLPPHPRQVIWFSSYKLRRSHKGCRPRRNRRENGASTGSGCWSLSPRMTFPGRKAAALPSLQLRSSVAELVLLVPQGAWRPGATCGW